MTESQNKEEEKKEAELPSNFIRVPLTKQMYKSG
jgi:hypothetical protein